MEKFWSWKKFRPLAQTGGHSTVPKGYLDSLRICLFWSATILIKDVQSTEDATNHQKDHPALKTVPYISSLLCWSFLPLRSGSSLTKSMRIRIHNTTPHTNVFHYLLQPRISHRLTLHQSLSGWLVRLWPRLAVFYGILKNVIPIFTFRLIGQRYQYQYQESIPCEQLVSWLCDIKQVRLCFLHSPAISLKLKVPYRPARLDLHESGIIGKPFKRTSTAICF